MEPATTTTGAIFATAAGLCGAFFATTGISPGVMLLAMLGSFIGAGFAPPAGRWRAIAMFPASCVLAAKAGIVGAAVLGPVGSLAGEELAQAMGGAFGVFLHPIIAAVARLIPQRLGVQQQ